MKANKKNTSNIINLCAFDSFCSSKDYYLYAAQSSNPLLHMAAQLRNELSCELSHIGDYVCFQHQAQPHFAVFHAHIDKGDPMDLYLMENKTLRYNQDHVTPIPEKGNPFSSFSLFEEYFYLFNAGRLALHKWRNVDIPYLIFFSISKETGISDIKTALEKTCQCSDMTSLIINPQNKNFGEIAQMFYTIELLKSQAIETRHRHIISGEMEVPDSAPRKYENIPIQISLNEDYLKQLKEDQTFERYTFLNRF